MAICGIECGKFRIESYVCAQAKLPGAFMPEVALSAQGVRSDAISRMDGRRREQFILIHQLQPGESIISFPEVRVDSSE
jgi:hypothetical protein